MNKQEFFFTDNKSGYKCKEAWVLNNHPELHTKINDHCLNIPTDSFTEKIWYYINDINEEYKCKCGSKTKFDTLKLGFRKFCSGKCPYCIQSVTDKRKASLIERYGVDNPMKFNEFKNKANATIKENYGVDNVSQLPEIKLIKEKKAIERYGVDNVFKSEVIKDKIKETNLERYGVEHVIQSEVIRDKIKETNLERYGVEHVIQSDIIKDKIKETNLEKYGVEYASQSDIIKEKIKETNLERYGYTTPLKNESVIEKTQSTLINKYGVTHISQVESIKQQKINTSLDRYGVEHTLQSENIKDKIKETNLERYGVEYTLQSKIIRDKINNTIWNKYGVEYISQSILVKEKISETYLKKINEKVHNYTFISETSDSLFYKCDKGHNFEISKSLLHQRYRFNNIICSECNPIGLNSVSNQEIIISEFMTKSGVEIIRNDRKIINPLEIDIVVPGKNIGFEFNGLYWHSDKFKDKLYHINKTKLSNENNLQLIHFFEDELHYKLPIVLSKVKNYLGLITDKIYARKCEIREVNPKDSMIFLNKNHMQGGVGSKIRYGLYYNDELVSLMTFGQLRVNMGNTNKKGHFELLRFCNKVDLNVIGGASKLFKHFIRNNDFSEIISYADLRFSNIDPQKTIYSKLGFEHTHITPPNYFYVKSNKRHNRFKYRKSELVKAGFSKDSTESEIMKNEGFYKIYDCGSHKFTYKKGPIK